MIDSSDAAQALDIKKILPPCYVSERARRVLGVAALDDTVASLCSTELGRENVYADSLGPISNEDFTRRQRLSVESRLWASLGVRPDFASITDLRPILDAVDKDGLLGAIDVMQIGRTADAMCRTRAFVESRAEELPCLAEEAAALVDDAAFAARLSEAFDSEGALTDEASKELLLRRGRVRTLRVKAKEVLDKQVDSYDEMAIMQERNFTIRHERYVLPIKSEFQGKVEGIVHDASQTGQTVFIEPRAMIDIGNRITIAHAAVKEEEHRILVEFTRDVRRRGPGLRVALAAAGKLEALFARGLFASKTGAIRPDVSHRGALRFPSNRHPQLLWARENNKDVVPQTMDFGGRKAMVISGPNAGGKTVALTSTGINAIWARSGHLVPTGSEASLPAYAAVLAAVGDEQDVERDLSTFSGHLEVVSEILSEVRTHSTNGPVLVLLDELCSGTSPEQGAALAQAMLEELVGLDATVIVTTHYERLKALAVAEETSDTFRNAKVETDVNTGKPTFGLALDSMGMSNAFDAARRHRVPSSIIERAEELMDPAAQKMQDLLSQLQAEVSHVEEARRKAEEETAKLAQKRKTLTKQIDELHQEQRRVRKGESQALLEDIRKARKEVATSIEAIRSGASGAELNELSHHLKAQEAAVGDSIEEQIVASEPVKNAKVGDKVYVDALPGMQLTIEELDDDHAMLVKGAVKMKVARDELRRTSQPANNKRPQGQGRSNAEKKRGKKKKKPKPKEQTRSLEEAGARKNPKTKDNTLDIRGERAGEALAKVDAFLDQMLLERETHVFVVHGHGTGALKNAVRAHFRQSPYVYRYDPAAPGDGGDGCTQVQLVDPRS